MSATLNKKRAGIHAVAFLAVMALLLTLSACRVEIGKLPLPTPSPSPSPTPVVDTNLTLNITSPQMTAPLSAAESNAKLFETATAEAAEEAESFHTSAQRLAHSPAPTAQEISNAAQALSAVQQSYRLAEAAVFYVDPDSPDELLSQPDPFGASSQGTGADALTEMATLFQELTSAAKNKSDKTALKNALSKLQDIATRSQEVREGMTSLALAWQDSDTSFRKRYFLANPDHAMARMFQGLLALSGDVIPHRWLTPTAPSPDEISGRVGALQTIFRGANDARGLRDLVAAKAPVQAAATEAAMVQMEALSQALKTSPNNVEVQRQLRFALREVTRQLTLSAQTLGIQIINEEK